MAERDIYLAIMRAAELGCGLRLTPEEVRLLSFDDAISTYAGNKLTEEEHAKLSAHTVGFWRHVDLRKLRYPANLSGYHKDDPDRPTSSGSE